LLKYVIFLSIGGNAHEYAFHIDIICNASLQGRKG